MYFNFNYLYFNYYTTLHVQGAANKSNPLPCFVNISATDRNFYNKKLHGYFSFISTYKCEIMLNYHNI